MKRVSLLRSSLDQLGFTAPEQAGDEAPLPLCVILEEEYRELYPQAAPRLSWLLAPGQVRDLRGLASKLVNADQPIAGWLLGHLSADTAKLLKRFVEGGAGEIAAEVLGALIAGLNVLLETGSLGAHHAFAKLPLNPLTKDLLERRPQGDTKVYLNRLLLEAAYPEEIAPIHQRRLAAFYEATRAHRTSALCISGGGIRSATFGLGLLQGLARYGLLGEFDYLSTVSGGGYIGSWFTAWVHRRGSQAVLEGLRSSVAACPPRSGAPPKDPIEPEPVPIRQLRAYSNYLSPRLGLLSADTWTLVAIYLRNLFLNWLVIVPLLAGVLLLPILGVAAVRARPVVSIVPWRSVVPWALAAGFMLVVLAVRYVHAHWPSALASPASDAHAREGGDQREFLERCFLPLVGATVILTTTWAWIATPGTAPLLGSFAGTVFGVPLSGSAPFGFMAFGALLHGLGWSLAQRRPTRLLPLQAGSVLITGAIAGWFAYRAATDPFGDLAGDEAPVAELYVVFAAPMFLVFVGAAGSLYVGLTSRWGSDEDREWAARFAAWLLIAAVGWSVASMLVIFGPPLLLDLGPQARGVAGSLGGIAGLVTLLGGYSQKTRATGDTAATTRLPVRLLLPLAAPVFAAFLIVLLALADLELVRRFAPPADASCRLAPLVYDPTDRLQIVHCAGYAWVAVLTSGLVLAGVVLGFFINTNRFSLHAMYRDRLIRAYLGASRTTRHPNRFTGFDPTDNIPMHDLWPNRPPSASRRAPEPTAHDEPPQDQASQDKPLHVINIALNLVAGQNLAWQQRKAESFTVTPLHAGSHRLGYRRTRYPSPSVCYGGRWDGISLGTAVTISGAAASPNMGYHSSPVVGFLMTLFNVRLGWWLGNPGVAGNETFQLAFPVSAIRPIVDEAFGLTDDTNKYVYLSDGGHFDNLGLYEAVLRRCGLVLVSDAGSDTECAFGDLGNAIRKVRIDLGVPIEFSAPLSIYHRSEHRVGKYGAIGTIRYSCVDGTPEDRDGVLVYVKPAFYGNEPRDIYNYAQTSAAFPHESTADQFFSEAQFESYRALGYYIASQVFGSGPRATTATLVQRAQGYLQAPASGAPP